MCLHRTYSTSGCRCRRRCPRQSFVRWKWSSREPYLRQSRRSPSHGGAVSRRVHVDHVGIRLRLRSTLLRRGVQTDSTESALRMQLHSPFTELGVRPAMLVSAGSVAATKAMIDRAVSAHVSNRKVTAYLSTTGDRFRDVRGYAFRPLAAAPPRGVRIAMQGDRRSRSRRDVLFHGRGARAESLRSHSNRARSRTTSRRPERSSNNRSR